MTATRFTHPMRFTGTYPSNWAGYRYKEALVYTTGVHTGVDYNYGAGAADKGLPIVSVANGIVRLAQNLSSKGFGNTVIVEHPLHPILQKELGTPALFSRYMHMENLSHVKVGQAVNIGQQIGTCGMTGATAYHLHLDLWKANLGVHTEYHKNTQLQSYLDPFLFIESHTKEIGESPMSPQEENEAYQIVLERPMEHGGSGRTGLQFVRDAKGELDAKRAAVRKQVADLQSALVNEQKKPPKEIVKEVEKIVEKIVEVDRPVEIIKEVEVVRFPNWLPEWVKVILEKLFKKG